MTIPTAHAINCNTMEAGAPLINDSRAGTTNPSTPAAKSNGANQVTSCTFRVAQEGPTELTASSMPENTLLVRIRIDQPQKGGFCASVGAIPRARPVSPRPSRVSELVQLGRHRWRAE
jgi:hypothetical protein